MNKFFRLMTVLVLSVGMTNAMAAATGKLKQAEFENSNEARQRGAEMVISTCMLCHSLKYVKFKDLMAIGMSEEEIESWLDDQKIDDRMMSLTPIEIREESYGKVPPDLSLITIARKQGPEYVYTLLTDYYYREDGETDNHFFPGIKMPDAMAYADAETDEERAEIETQVRDLVAFLNWTADPNADRRTTLGIYVIIYLVILTAMLYLLKNRIWRRVHAMSAAE